MVAHRGHLSVTNTHSSGIFLRLDVIHAGDNATARCDGALTLKIVMPQQQGRGFGYRNSIGQRVEKNPVIT